MLRLEETKQDVLYAVRMMKAARGFTSIACLTLVLGIGATTAIFSVVNAVLLRPLPYKEVHRLVHVLADDPGDPRSGVSYRAFELWRSSNRTLSDLAVYYRNTGFSRVTVGGTTQPESVQAGFVSSSFFIVLGLPPANGRVFDESEQNHRDTVVVLSHALSLRRFGSESAIGKTIEIDGRAFTVIGVMPPEFQFPARETQLWLPITTNRFWLDRPKPDNVHTRGYYMRWNVVGRLRPGVTPEAAFADLTHQATPLSQDDPGWNMGLPIKVMPLSIEITGDARLALLVLLTSVCLVLVIACTNVANLMLARGAVRAREMSIRAALGATQSRVIRQVLTESLVLVLISIFGAVMLATVAVQALVRNGPADLPRLEETTIDVRVFCFALLVSGISAVLFGLMPAINAGRRDPNEYMKSGGRAVTTGVPQVRTGGLLIVAEFAIAALLLASSGLLIRSMRELENVPLGFRADQVLTMRVRLPDGFAATRKTAFVDELLARLRAVAGVEAAGGINSLFEPGGPPINSLRIVEDQPIEQSKVWPLTWTTVSGDYFKALRIPLLAGRHFSERDSASSPLVAVIDEAMARRYWPNQNPLGKRFKGQDARGRNDEWLTVIGVVGNTRRQGLEQEPTSHVYEWHAQAGPTNDWVVRTLGVPEAFVHAMRSAVHEIEPHAVVANLTTMQQQIESQTASRRFQTWLLSLFASMATLLSSIGIYGVISYATVQRTHEIGIRTALGAQRSNIVILVLCQGLMLSLAGVIVGLGIALLLTHLLSSLLYGVTPTDPLTFAATAILLLTVSIYATLVPAIRATRTDPIAALRAG